MSGLSLAGRVAIVTGAGRGLGRAHALALAARGARLVVNDLGGGMDGREASKAPADGVVAEIRALGGEAVASHHSVADPGGGRAIVDCALEAFGTVDIVVNNAGTFLGGAFDEVALDDFSALIQVHLLGAAAVTHAAWPVLREKGYGRVVMTVSSAGFWGLPRSAAYCAGKAGTFGLARALALEGEPLGIKVNMLAPGAKTRSSEALFGGRAGWTWRPELVTPALVYLASEGCRHNGAVFAALAGQFARIEAVQGPGRAFDPRGDISAEDFVAAIDEIESLQGARAQDHGLSREIREAARAGLRRGKEA